jgi:hypothetical protein
MPAGVRRIALVAMGNTAARLRSVVDLSIRRDIAVALFTDQALASLPAQVEVNPLSALTDALAWADFIIIDVPLNQLSHMRSALGLSSDALLPFPGQALVVAPMPCAGLAECGVCALPVQRGWKLLCKEGPVVELNGLLGGLP